MHFRIRYGAGRHDFQHVVSDANIQIEIWDGRNYAPQVEIKCDPGEVTDDPDDATLPAVLLWTEPGLDNEAQVIYGYHHPPLEG